MNRLIMVAMLLIASNVSFAIQQRSVGIVWWWAEAVNVLAAGLILIFFAHAGKQR